MPLKAAHDVANEGGERNACRAPRPACELEWEDLGVREMKLAARSAEHGHTHGVIFDKRLKDQRAIADERDVVLDAGGSCQQRWTRRWPNDDIQDALEEVVEPCEKKSATERGNVSSGAVISHLFPLASRICWQSAKRAARTRPPGSGAHHISL